MMTQSNPFYRWGKASYPEMINSLAKVTQQALGTARDKWEVLERVTEAGPGVECPAAISGCLPPPKPSLPSRLRGRAVPATWPPMSPGSLGGNGAAFLGSAGHLCCQDGALGQACYWICQQLGIN